jgi:hypothetical protein
VPPGHAIRRSPSPMETRVAARLRSFSDNDLSMRLVPTHTAVLVVPLAVSVLAVAALVSWPQSELVWRLGAWALVVAALVLLIGLPVTAYSLARDAGARTWPRSIAFATGTLYMSLLVFGALV